MSRSRLPPEKLRARKVRRRVEYALTTAKAAGVILPMPPSLTVGTVFELRRALATARDENREDPAKLGLLRSASILAQAAHSVLLGGTLPTVPDADDEGADDEDDGDPLARAFAG